MGEDLNYSVFMRKRIQTVDLHFAFYNNMITDSPEKTYNNIGFLPRPFLLANKIYSTMNHLAQLNAYYPITPKTVYASSR